MNNHQPLCDRTCREQICSYLRNHNNQFPSNPCKSATEKDETRISIPYLNHIQSCRVKRSKYSHLYIILDAPNLIIDNRGNTNIGWTFHGALDVGLGCWSVRLLFDWATLVIKYILQLLLLRSDLVNFLACVASSAPSTSQIAVAPMSFDPSESFIHYLIFLDPKDPSPPYR
mgnify:CR=1 FL=1